MIITRITVEDASGFTFGHITYPDVNGDVAVHVGSQEAISLQAEEIDNLIRALKQAKESIFPGAK